MELKLPTSSGVVAIGLKTGLVIPYDDIAAITTEAVKDFVDDKDIICVTEAVVARSQNHYVNCKDLATEIQTKLNLKPKSTLAVISPIASRNRFALILRALSMATRGGKIIVQLSIPFDEVGNQVIEEGFATTRLRLKKTLQSLREARGNTPQFNVLIREIIAALKLQELGYNIISIRKITGQGIADLTVKTPDGQIAVIEVTFADTKRAAIRALGILEDVANATLALAITVNLEHDYLQIVDAKKYLDEDCEPTTYSFSEQMASYNEPDVIFINELGNRIFAHPITNVDYRHLYLEQIAQGGSQGEVIYTNNPLKVYNFGYIDGICIGAIHEQNKLKELFDAFGAMVPVITLKDIGPRPWGIIGSNVSDYEGGILKLLPENADETAQGIKENIKTETGKEVEVIIFGDGAYKDPDTGIYELADPHPAIGVSKGLQQTVLRTGTKLKLQVDTLSRQGYSREEIAKILETNKDAVTTESMGTTPRSITSLVASLADLVTGSADAGTPIVLVRGFKYC